MAEQAVAEGGGKGWAGRTRDSPPRSRRRRLTEGRRPPRSQRGGVAEAVWNGGGAGAGGRAGGDGAGGGVTGMAEAVEGGEEGEGEAEGEEGGGEEGEGEMEGEREGRHFSSRRLWKIRGGTSWREVLRLGCSRDLC